MQAYTHHKQIKCDKRTNNKRNVRQHRRNQYVICSDRLHAATAHATTTYFGWIHEPKSLARRGDTFRYPGNPEIRRFGSDFAGNPNVQNSYPKRANRNLNVQFLVRSPQVRILNVQLPGSKSSSTILKVLHSEPKPNIGTDT